MALSAFSCDVNMAGARNVFLVPQGIQRDSAYLPRGCAPAGVAWGNTSPRHSWVGGTGQAPLGVWLLDFTILESWVN